mmetsp:Transcript_4478/g.10228  ORF Transcript_4478/g.10228 Transcript_4478/m.10228 type:complete len:340 (+) Transcript_4478:538-1557(+)
MQHDTNTTRTRTPHHTTHTIHTYNAPHKQLLAERWNPRKDCPGPAFGPVGIPERRTRAAVQGPDGRPAAARGEAEGTDHGTAATVGDQITDQLAETGPGQAGTRFREGPIGGGNATGEGLQTEKATPATGRQQQQQRCCEQQQRQRHHHPQRRQIGPRTAAAPAPAGPAPGRNHAGTRGRNQKDQQGDAPGQPNLQGPGTHCRRTTRGRRSDRGQDGGIQDGRAVRSGTDPQGQPELRNQCQLHPHVIHSVLPIMYGVPVLRASTTLYSTVQYSTVYATHSIQCNTAYTIQYWYSSTTGAYKVKYNVHYNRLYHAMPYHTIQLLCIVPLLQYHDLYQSI